MPLVADTELVLILVLVGVALLVAIIAVALIAVTRVLKQLSVRLEAVVTAFGERDPGAEEALMAITADLKAGQALLDDVPDPEDAESN